MSLLYDFGSIQTIKLSCMILKNDHTNFKNLVVFTLKKIQRMFDQFSTLYMTGLNVTKTTN